MVIGLYLKKRAGAEWIQTRFGNDRGGRLAHIVVVLFAVISVLGFLAYLINDIYKRYINPDSVCKGVRSLQFNGKAIDSSHIPAAAAGTENEVEVLMGAD